MNPSVKLNSWQICNLKHSAVYLRTPCQEQKTSTMMSDKRLQKKRLIRPSANYSKFTIIKSKRLLTFVQPWRELPVFPAVSFAANSVTRSDLLMFTDIKKSQDLQQAFVSILRICIHDGIIIKKDQNNYTKKKYGRMPFLGGKTSGTLFSGMRKLRWRCSCTAYWLSAHHHKQIKQGAEKVIIWACFAATVIETMMNATLY